MTIIRVQGNAKGTTITNIIYVTMDSTPTNGNLLIATIAGRYALAVSSISQTGVTWTRQVANSWDGPHGFAEIWAGVVGSGASTSITVTLNQSAIYGAIADICEYSGLITSGFLDKTATAKGGPTVDAVTGTTGTTSQTTELWIGCIESVNTGQTNPINDFTLLDGIIYMGDPNHPEANGYLEKIVSSTGTASSGDTMGGSTYYVGCIATFKGIVNCYKTVTELFGALDTKTKTKSIHRIIAELLGLFDIPHIPPHYKEVLEYLGCLDTKSRIKMVYRIEAELLGMLDMRSKRKEIHRIVTELLELKLIGYYRKSHVINFAAGAGTNYQKQITVHYGSGTDGDDDVYLNSHCRTDFGDVRFTDDDGSTKLDYWMESKVNGDYAVFWVEVADNLSTVAQTIYICYGNPMATTTTSNPQNTFPFFDDFNTYRETWDGGTVDPTNHWISFTSAIKGTLRADIPQACIMIKLDWAFVNLTAGIFSLFDSQETLSRYGRPHGVWSKLAFDGDYFGGDPPAIGVFWSSSFHTCGFKWGGVSAGSQYTGFVDASSANAVGTKPVTSNYAIHKVNLSNDSGTSKVTNIRVQKYVSPEPTHGAWGNEENLGLGGIKSSYRTITELVGLLDVKSRIKSIYRTITELLGAIDSEVHKVTQVLKHVYKTVTEILGGLDVVSRIKSIHRIVIEFLGALDIKSRVKSIHRTIIELLGSLDATQKVIRKLISSTLGLADLVGPSLLKKISVFARTLLGRKKAYVLLKTLGVRVIGKTQTKILEKKLGVRVLTKKETIKYEGIVKKDDEGT